MKSGISKTLIVATTLLSLNLGFGDLSVTSAYAQATSNLQQGFIKGPGKRVSLTPKDTLEVSTDETVIFPNLKGIVIIDNPNQVRDSGANANGVEANSDVIPSQVISAAQPYIDQAVSLASLDRLTRDMVLAFREAGIPVVNVVVPPQDVTNSVVQILAVVGRLGETTVEGEASNPEDYLNDFPLTRGDVIDEESVVNHLRWKSRRQNRRVNAIYAPGSSFGETDIAFDVTETKPWSVFIGADSSGPGSSGDNRIFAGLIINDLFVNEDEFSYQFTTSEDGFDSLAAHVFQYTFPVAPRADLQFTGAIVDSSSTNALAGNSNGESSQFSVTLIKQLNRQFNFYWDGKFGFDYKNSNNSFEFAGGATTPGAETDVGQFFALFEGERVMGRSRTNVFAGIWASPGDLYGSNNDVAFNASRAGATSEYIYARAGIEHRYDFDNKWSFNFEAEGQVSSSRLIASEQFYLGGINTVRGFQENVIRGDNGIFASAELYTPVHEVENDGKGISIRGFGFFDIGQASVEGTPSATEGSGSASISGAGIGLSFAMFDRENAVASLSGELSYGWKVSDDPLNTTDPDDGQFHFRIVTRF